MRIKTGLVLKGKKVVVWGMGISGLSALKLLLQEGADVWALNQGDLETWANKEEIKQLLPYERCLFEETMQVEEKLASVDLIILAPGIPRTHPLLKKAHLYDVPIWGEIELGWHFVHYPVIAVTGSNGKTTTTSLLAEMIQRAGKKVFVGGNIGVPLCEYARKQERYDVILLELSSFQLESVFEFRADIGLILNLVMTHGERYSDFEQYKKAKWRLAERISPQGHLFYDGQIDWPSHIVDKAPSSSTLVDTSRLSDIKAILGRNYDMGAFYLPGDHNILNLFFAINALEMLNKQYSLFKAEELHKGIQETINHFGGVPHRIQRVKGHKEYLCFNDSKSTNWQSTIVAVKSMDSVSGHFETPLWLVLGGKIRGKGESIAPHLPFLKEKCQRLLVFGDSANALEEQVFDQMPLTKCRTLGDVIDYVDKKEFKGILLFSPAFPSFDQYKNYEDRGDHFIKLVGGTPPPRSAGH